ncbi:glycoside hydrolase family 18 protein [Herbidospora sp. RD11066]
MAVPLVLAVTGMAVLRLDYLGTPVATARSAGTDALWMGHMWVDGRRTEKDLEELKPRLTHMRDLFVHSGPYGPDGKLDPNLHPKSRDFLNWARNQLPGVRVLPWLGQTVDEEDRGSLDLGDPATRANIIAGAREIVALGYDGVHYNFEPVVDGDADYLKLLDETRAAIPNARISVSSHQIEPFPGAVFTWNTVVGHGKYWSEAYFTTVAEKVDQVAVMTYDSWTPLQTLYGGWVARQARKAFALAPKETSVLIGAPAYHDHMVGVSDYAESVEMAAEGMRLAITETPRENAGLALYVDFAATEQDWKEYLTSWVLVS